jgi:hypothetical protein
VRLARRRPEQPPPVAEIPADTKGTRLTGPVVLCAVIRALAIAVAVAIAFRLHVPYADWMPLAAQVAMKTNMQQSTLAATHSG